MFGQEHGQLEMSTIQRLKDIIVPWDSKGQWIQAVLGGHSIHENTFPRHYHICSMLLCKVTYLKVLKEGSHNSCIVSEIRQFGQENALYVR